MADALVDYQPESVRIRTLDKPPPELDGGGDGATFQLTPTGFDVRW
ncbi:MAG: hypothetical protein ABEL76_05940 [Bradymonadaceae bacterium]